MNRVLVATKFNKVCVIERTADKNKQLYCRIEVGYKSRVLELVYVVV